LLYLADVVVAALEIDMLDGYVFASGFVQSAVNSAEGPA
jgi:hypothetical protein